MKQRGFTLVESLIVIVVLAIAGVVIGSMQGKIFSGQASVKDLQVRSRLMQECAEQVLGVRHFTQDGYVAVTAAAFGTNYCGRTFDATGNLVNGGITALTGYTVPSVTLTDPYTGAACPDGRTCMLVSITQNDMTPLTLMLVNY
jgi:prepilin-type N-terminal cleavage/methylation domain-containing protein